MDKLERLKQQQTQLVVQRATLKDQVDQVERHLTAIQFAIQVLEGEEEVDE